MMELVSQAGFVAAAYAAGVLVIAVLILWIIADYRAQRRILAELERRGVTRRSGARPQDAA
jgi:heme exporter protein D